MRQRVLITAGADGIGLEIAKCFLKKNALVWVADLNQNAIGNLPKSINARCVDVCDVDMWVWCCTCVCVFGCKHLVMSTCDCVIK